MQFYLDKSVAQFPDEETKAKTKASFGLKDTINEFRKCCTVAETRLIDGVLDKFPQFDSNFANLNFEQVAIEANEQAGEIARHISFDTHFWLTFQEELIRSYMYCFFKSVLKKQIKLNDVKDKPTKDKEIYATHFDQNKAELFDDLKDLIDGSFHNIPAICSKIRDMFPGIFTIKNIVALIKQRTDADKKDIDDMISYCEKKFVAPKTKPNTQDRIQQKVEANSSNNNNESKVEDEEEEEFDMEEWQRSGGLNLPEEDKTTDLKAHINKTMAGYLDYKGNRRYFSIQGEKMFCYKNKKETLADNDTFPTLSLKDIKSVVAKSNGFTLKFIDTSNTALEFSTLANEDPDKWVDCIKNNLDDLKESSPKRVIQARPSVGGTFEVKKLTPSNLVPFEVEDPSARTGNLEAITEEEPRRGSSVRIAPKSVPKGSAKPTPMNSTANPAKPVVIYREPGFLEKCFSCFPCCLRREDI